MPIDISQITARNILTEAKGYLDVGFTHSLNPYSGCAFACSYCYVREMPIQQFRETPWGEWIDIKTNAVECYRKEVQLLRRRKKRISVFMSSVTDPYQPVEREAGVTRALLEAMIIDPPDFLQIQTRSPLVTRDIDALTTLSKRCSLLISMTIETDRDEIRRIFSPYAPGITQRVKALQRLHENGIKTQASISPVLPFSREFPTILQEIVDVVWIDTMLIGDGSSGARSKSLGMPELFRLHDLSDWYDPKLHEKVQKYFRKFFSSELVRIGKKQAYPEGDLFK